MILGSALWAMLVAGIAGPAWSVLEDRERYRMLKYLYVSPATFLVLLVGRGGARLAAGAMGTAVALVFAVIILGLRIDLAAVQLAAVRRVPRARASCRSSPSACCSPPSASRRARRAGPTRTRSPGALFLISGRRVPAVHAAAAAPGHRPRQPHHLVGRGRPARARARRARRRSAAPGSVWTAVTGSAAPDGTTIVIALCVTGALATLAAIATFRSSERRARDLGLLDRTTGS